jgi:multidrug transporter EmrE-like cation transporter
MIKKYNTTNKLHYILFAVLAYSFLTFLYSQLLKSQDMSCLYSLINIVSILTVIFIGVIFYKEKIDRYSICGIILSIIAILFFLKSSYDKQNELK